ncbi:MAG: right-handed parallel beta-helix repeat-containing protein [Candidatus Thiodiazotropha sp.]
MIEDSLAYHNGYQPDGIKVPGVPGETVGGGNSDGIGAFKSCAESAALLSVPNLCPDSLLRGNIAWHNADDGIDISFGDNSSLIDNISFENGPEGNKGFKVYAKVRGGISFIGNVAMGNISNGFEFQIEETGSVYNNTSIRNNLHGFRASISAEGQLTSTNNLGTNNTGSIDIDIRDGILNTTNWAFNQDGDPLIAIPDFSNTRVDTTVLDSSSIAQKVRAIKNQFATALVPQRNSPLIDAGTFIAGIHCPRADDADDPMPLYDHGCRHWRGSAPDIGAYEYGNIIVSPPMPPILLDAR